MGFHAFVRRPAAERLVRRPRLQPPRHHCAPSYRPVDLPATELRRTEGEVSALRDTVTTAQQSADDAGQPVRAATSASR